MQICHMNNMCLKHDLTRSELCLFMQLLQINPLVKLFDSIESVPVAHPDSRQNPFLAEEAPGHRIVQVLLHDARVYVTLWEQLSVTSDRRSLPRIVLTVIIRVRVDTNKGALFGLSPYATFDYDCVKKRTKVVYYHLAKNRADQFPNLEKMVADGLTSLALDEPSSDDEYCSDPIDGHGAKKKSKAGGDSSRKKQSKHRTTKEHGELPRSSRKSGNTGGRDDRDPPDGPENPKKKRSHHGKSGETDEDEAEEERAKDDEQVGEGSGCQSRTGVASDEDKDAAECDTSIVGKDPNRPMSPSRSPSPDAVPAPSSNAYPSEAQPPEASAGGSAKAVSVKTETSDPPDTREHIAKDVVIKTKVETRVKEEIKQETDEDAAKKEEQYQQLRS